MSNKFYLVYIRFLIKRLLLFFTVLFLIILGIDHAHKGINLTDEGVYLSAPLSYVFGNIPFKDEVYTTSIPFDKLTWSVFEFFPNISVFHYRLIGLLVILSSLIVYFFLLRRLVPTIFASIVILLMFTLNNFNGILSPGYDLLGSSFSLIAMCLLICSQTFHARNRLFIAALGGFFLYLSVISYPSMFVVLVIPIFLLFTSIYLGKDSLFSIQAILIFILVFLGALILSLYYLYIVGLLPFLDYGIKAYIFVRYTGVGFLSTMLDYNLPEYLRWFCNSIPLYVCILLYFALLPKICLIKGFYRLLFGYLLISCCSLIFYFSLDAQIVFQLITFIVVVSIYLFIRLIFRQGIKRILSSQSGVFYTITLLWSLLLAFAIQNTSANIYFKGMQAIAPLIGVIFLGSYYLISTSKKEIYYRHISFIFLVVLGSITLFKSTTYYSQSIYGEENSNNLSTYFSYSKLRGIKSNVLRVNRLERLLSYLEPKLNRGEYFFAYNNLPIIYYLTNTRSAYALTWAGLRLYPTSIQKDLFTNIITENKLPRYAVRMTTTSPEGRWPISFYCGDNLCPEDQFVKSNYSLIKVLYPFEVWKLDQEKKLRYDKLAHNIWTLDISSPMHLSEIAKENPDFAVDMNWSYGSPVYEIMPINTDKNKTFKINLSFSDEIPSYSLNNNYVVLIRARLEGKTVEPAYLFIKQQENSSINSVYIIGKRWDSYVVGVDSFWNKKKLEFGIIWNGRSLDSKLTIKSMKILIN